MREQPEQQAPPVQRLRVRYAKRGRLRFTSHRDFSRAFERALVRARIPMAYSSGFNPHPRISYAGAAPTGAASEAEYLEIGLAEVVDPARLAADLDDALPDGLDVVEVVEASPGSLADRLQASRWRDRPRRAAGRRSSAAVEAFLAAASVTVERMTKKGLRTFDSRAAVLALDVDDVRRGVAARRSCCGTPCRRSGRTTCWPGCARWAASSDRARRWSPGSQQGPYDEATGAIGDPLSS